MNEKDKIEYVKPQVQDLGALGSIYGAVCNPTGSVAAGDCSTGGVPTTCIATGLAPQVLFAPPGAAP